MEASDINMNKAHWNPRVEVHLESDLYNMAAFRNGKSSLNPTELEELKDVVGKRLCHLQCHFGQDSLSWVREGAEVTGLDFSETAIETARQLSKELNLPAQFVCANVLDASKVLRNDFDIVFTSYGTIGWIPDLKPWAEQVYKLLKPGGVFYIVDFHPVVWMFNNDLTEVGYSYFNVERIVEETSGTYADREADLKSTSVSWNHPLSEITSSLISSGLEMKQMHEFGFTWYDVFPDLEPRPEGGFRHKTYGEKLPMMYSFLFQKPA